MTETTEYISLDLFAGTGWGVASEKLGIEEYGVEIMKAAQLTRAANGFNTVFPDVWTGLEDATQVPNYNILIASPPCQSYSRAGKGAGRRALDEVLATIHQETYKTPEKLKALSEELGFDDKTALVLSPLAYAYRDRPKMIALEQVTSVLPVWEANAEVLEGLGYKVWTGIINSEQYGVPQARRRAYLLAVLNDNIDEMTPPPATHSQYYPRNPGKLDEGVEKWISMAEGLNRSEEETALLPDWTKNRPSTTIVGSFRPDIIAAPGWRKPGDGPRQNTPNSVQVTFAEAARLQSYPDDFEWAGAKGKQWLQVGNAVPPFVAEAVLKHLIDMASR